jgi:hypothetical protein
MALNIPSLVVSAVTTFDGKALSKGSKQISAFEKSAKKAGGALAAAFSVQAIVKFGKEAAKAFIQDEKAASQLAQSVKNLGLAFETPKIERFISELSAASGVADDVLRPSMQKLLQTTGSVTKSQELLTQALDISRGSGVEYGTVVADLSAAYVGNTKGLKKYSLGLTNAELTSMSFSKVQEKLTSQFSGANAAYLATYAGQLELLNTAAGEAKESIGKGLVTALQLLAGEGNTVQPLADSMADFGTYLGDAIIGTGLLVDKLNKIPGMGKAGGAGLKAALLSNPVTGGLFALKEATDELSKAGAEYTKARTIPTQGYYGSMAVGIYPTAAEEAKRKKAADDAAKREKALAAEKLKGAKLDKQKVALTKAAAVFDSTRISLTAALQATYDKETKLRLEALMLIEEDKGDAALKKIGELAAFQKNADMQRLAGVTDISNATLGSLNTQLLTELKVINSSRMAEGDKEFAREEAFKKYNAAITAAGTLATKESYNERVQIQLTEIARLASISKTYSAAATANLLLESSELSMIDRVAIAQKAADDQRLAALKEYQNALNGTGGGGGGGGGTFRTTSFTENGPLGGLAAGVIAGVLPTLSQMPTLTDTAPTYGYNPTQGFPGQSIELTINTGIGDPEAIARAVEDLLNQSSYRGTSTNRGSGNYIL